MSEEMKLLLKLTEENAKLKTTIRILKGKVIQAEKKDRNYVDIDEFLPVLNECVEDRELTVITFDNCGDAAYEA